MYNIKKANPYVCMTGTKCPYCNHAHEDIDQEIKYKCDECKRVFLVGELTY